MNSDPEGAAIDHVAQRLSRQFTNIDTVLVTRVVWDTYRHFDTHPTRDVVPIRVQDAARGPAAGDAHHRPRRTPPGTARHPAPRNGR